MMVKEVFNRILVPFDDSPHAQKALDYAIRIAKSADASLHVLTVLDISYLGLTKDVSQRFSPYYEEAPPISDVTERYRIAYSDKFEDIKHEDTYKEFLKVADHAKKICKKKDIEATAVILMGNVAETIVAFSEDNSIDLIVMGSRGFSGFRRLLMGHVSSDVAEKAHCPVLIIR